jgi:hypothetical protein
LQFFAFAFTVRKKRYIKQTQFLLHKIKMDIKKRGIFADFKFVDALKNALLKIISACRRLICRYISRRFDFRIVFYIMHVLWHIPCWNPDVAGAATARSNILMASAIMQAGQQFSHTSPQM